MISTVLGSEITIMKEADLVPDFTELTVWQGSEY